MKSSNKELKKNEEDSIEDFDNVIFESDDEENKELKEFKNDLEEVEGTNQPEEKDSDDKNLDNKSSAAVIEYYDEINYILPSRNNRRNIYTKLNSLLVKLIHEVSIAKDETA